MPEMHFRVRWPDGKIEDCYSPSYVIEEHLTPATSYPVPDFLERVRTALTIASDRVLARYGFECSSALDQLRAIESTARSLAPAALAGSVAVLSFVKHAPRDARKKLPPEHHPVIVVGGGQAGLSASYCLAQRGIDHVVLESQRVAHSWRSERWDTFCLVTPNWQCKLPGHAYSGPEPQGFMQKDRIVEYVEAYAQKYELPVREHVQVFALGRGSSGRFELETSLGSFSADQVVVATGCYHEPRVPAFGSQAPARVMQVHSSAYRNPESLPEGPVLVVGTGQSGCQIAEDLHFAGRTVHLAVGDAPRCARRYRGRDVVEWLDALGYYDIPIDRHPNREQVRDKTNHYVTGRDGGRDIDLRKLALEGMRLYGPLVSISEGRARFAPELRRNLDAADDVYRSINRTIDAYIEKAGIDAPPGSTYEPVWTPNEEPRELDLEAEQVAAIVWCTGFSSNFRWISAPVFDDHGFPVHERGVTAVPGLYFLGLPWLYTWGSGRFSGVGRDAEYVVERIAALRATESADSAITQVGIGF